jgi:hypothetical protein
MVLYVSNNTLLFNVETKFKTTPTPLPIPRCSTCLCKLCDHDA